MDLDNPSYFAVSGENRDEVDCKISKNKNVRSLLRSLSSNSADSNQELLILGEPRLNDIAPELSVRYQAEPRRANSLKSNKSSGNNRSEILYSPLDLASEGSEEEEVFLSEETARYYNLSAGSRRRRHSISIMGRERSTSLASSSRSFKEDFPQAIIHASQEGSSIKSTAPLSIDDHSLRHGSYPRKRCNRCTRVSGKRSADMDDILIISVKESAPAKLWVEYFASYFEQISKHANKKPYKVYQLGVEEIIDLKGDVRLLAEKTAGVKLQIIILCPLMLEKIAENVQSTAGLSKILLPDRILALQLGTSDDDVSDIHKTALTSFSQWQRRDVGQDQDANFANEFVTTAMAIFSKTWKQQSLVATEENSQFSVSPKKIRQGQTSILILLTHPLHKEDILKITVVKNDELTEIKSIKRRNPYTLKITIPEKFLEVSAIVNVLVEKNGSFIGKRPIKCESRLRELEQILRSSNNPVEFMCQTLGFSPHDIELLDNWMVHMFQKNIPPNFNLFVNSEALNSNKHVCEEFPTLLHFAAKFGLEKLTAQLLDCPGGDVACEIRNINDHIPADIAENSEHQEIAHMLRGYMKMNEFTTMYTKLKYLTNDVAQTPIIEEDSYLQPRSLSDFYKTCPAPRPVPKKVPSTLRLEESSVYLPMDSNKTTPIITPTSETATSPKSPLSFTKSTTSLFSSQTNIHHRNAKESEKCKNSPIIEDKVQIELAEIMNDFKNNVHTIAQTEQLVAEWQSRNDVQKSFKEKQDQLKLMRLKYEQIQREIKANTKRASPFERIKKIFAWGSHSKEDHHRGDYNVSTQRPISSLSLQSTSSSVSSGRTSTISGCSLGDSGTHSDHEERKIILNNHDDEFRNDVNKNFNLNYMIPPAPKPVISNKHVFATIEERSHSNQATEDSDSTYYIQYPPNGSPVENLTDKSDTVETEKKENELITQQYMNISSNQMELSHEYMNFKAP